MNLRNNIKFKNILSLMLVLLLLSSCNTKQKGLEEGSGSDDKQDRTSNSSMESNEISKESEMEDKKMSYLGVEEVTGNSSKRIRIPNQKIRGVNLGSWLLLERWMVPELFERNNAKSNDEYNFMDELGDEKEQVMHEHYQTFITEDDFKWLAEHGINNVRIPVGYWIFDGKDHFVKNIEYLDKAFEWAEKHNISILVDLHGVRDSQNGFDNSGLEGKALWHTKQENIDEAVDIISKLSKRYKDERALFGIAVLNEPSWEIPMEILRAYYLRAYEAVMEHLDKSKHWVVIHDGFRFKEWSDFMQDDYYNNVILDTHMYHVFDPEDKNLSIFDQLRKAAGSRAESIREMSKYFPVVVGEWSLGLHGDKLSALGDSEQILNALQAFATTQKLAYSQGAGWYFWSYKQSEKATGSGSGWNYRFSVENNWIPNSKTK